MRAHNPNAKAPPTVVEAIHQYQWLKAHEFYRSTWGIPIITHEVVSEHHESAVMLLTACGYDIGRDPEQHWLYSSLIRTVAAEQGDKRWLVKESSEAPDTIADVACRECGERMARPTRRTAGAWSGLCEFCQWAGIGKGLVALFGDTAGRRIAKSIYVRNGVRFKELREKDRIPPEDAAVDMGDDGRTGA